MITCFIMKCQQETGPQVIAQSYEEDHFERTALGKVAHHSPASISPLLPLPPPTIKPPSNNNPHAPPHLPPPIHPLPPPQHPTHTSIPLPPPLLTNLILRRPLKRPHRVRLQHILLGVFARLFGVVGAGRGVGVARGERPGLLVGLGGGGGGLAAGHCWVGLVVAGCWLLVGVLVWGGAEGGGG